MGILIRAQEELFNKLHITSGPMGAIIVIIYNNSEFFGQNLRPNLRYSDILHEFLEYFTYKNFCSASGRKVVFSQYSL